MIARAAAALPAAPGRVAAPLPGDVRLMNRVSGTVFVGVALALVAAGVARLARAPQFDIALIRIEGDLARSSVPTIRANALPALAGSFFGIDLQRARRAFEQVPWVRRATVRRVWPDQLVVRLEEHRAAALWEAAAAGGATERLVNSHGEVFEANLGDVEDEGLPRLAGPEGSAAAMLAMFRRLAPAFEARDLAIERLALSGRGSWRAEMARGAVIELGRGSEDEVVARSERFLRTLPQAAGRWPAPIEYADLRHTDGYALRLRGVGTAPVPPAGATARN